MAGGPELALPSLVWPLSVAALLAYGRAAVRLRGRGQSWSGWRIASFAVGMAITSLAVSPALSAHHDLRSHMVRHLLLGMLAPLAIVLGDPCTLMLRTVAVSSARRAVRIVHRAPLRWLAHPVTALALDSGGLYILHFTPLYAAMLASPLLQAAVHLHFLAAGCLFAWSVVGVVPSPARAPMRVRLLVLGVAIAAHATLAKVMYAWGWPRGTPYGIEEIRAAAKLMYYGGDAIELLLLVALFAAWYRRPIRRLAPGQ